VDVLNIDWRMLALQVLGVMVVVGILIAGVMALVKKSTR
jgi:hypothetical protein